MLDLLYSDSMVRKKGSAQNRPIATNLHLLTAIKYWKNEDDLD